jgi:hypothetical protein
MVRNAFAQADNIHVRATTADSSSTADGDDAHIQNEMSGSGAHAGDDHRNLHRGGGEIDLTRSGCGNPQTPKVPDWRVFVPNPDISG